MFIAAGQGRTTPGDKILMSTETSCHLLQVSKKSLWSLILYIFFLILYMYVAPGQGLTTPWGQNFDAKGTSCHFGHLLQVSKKSLSSLIVYIFFHDFTHVYSPWAEGKVLMSTEMSCHFIHLLQVSKKCLWSLISYNFFHDSIHVYSPEAGADSPQETKFWCQQKGLITLPICCKFQRNPFEVWFYTIFFQDLIHVYSPRAGGIQPQGTKFWRQQKLLVTSVICC